MNSSILRPCTVRAIIPSLLDGIYKLIHQGDYAQALQSARRISIDLLKDNRSAEASLALSAAAHVLCLLNHPSKARGFAQEAHELAGRAQDTLAAGFALSIGALAQLRLGQFEPAHSLADRALEDLNRHPHHFLTAFGRLVAAEIAISADDLAEARILAEDAFATGASINAPWIKARARLITAICAEHGGDLPAALEFLRTAAEEITDRPEPETQWLVKAALANASLKAGDDAGSAVHRREAVEIINSLASRLDPEVRQRFLKSPAIVNAIGEDLLSASATWRVPVQIAGASKSRSDEASFATLRPVFDVIKKINTELNLRKLISMILDTMIEFCNAQRGTIVLFEEDTFKIELSRDRGKNELKRFEMGVSRTVLKLVRDHGKRVVTEDAQQDASLRLIDTVQGQSLLSILCVPLRVKTRLIGAVYLDNPYEAGAFGTHEIEIAEILTDHAAVAIDNALLHIKSTHDGLTSLFNHPHFEKLLDTEVARARRRGRRCGLLMMDVDNFKHINDSFGHDAGNEILKSVARLIAHTVREADVVARIQESELAPIVARYGGDEFEIVLPEANREGLQSCADRLLAAVRAEPLMYAGHPVKIAFSIGGAVYPEDAPNARELLLRADEALYEAKRAGKDRFVACSPPPPVSPP